MTCDVCKQGQATVHLTEIVDDQMTELHLCEECASQKGAQMESHFGLADLLAGLADFGKQLETEEVAGQKCANCALTFEDFRKVGRLGCSECYTTFHRSLATLLKRIHGSTHHLGKSPMKTATRTPKVKSELVELKRKLQEAIDVEEFETAARLRDQIRELEQNKHRKA
ncbi:MAG: UvrB/UvrC motif-containing protein [Candidatus Omnitrophica bacterium]|nr:UvrB/UvrC motif-containing protein [Candidatus Omnitrophota bacterium]